MEKYEGVKSNLKNFLQFQNFRNFRDFNNQEKNNIAKKQIFNCLHMESNQYP